MRIGIDASRAFVDQPTGTERYTFEVITRLLAMPAERKHEWILYVRSQRLAYSVQADNVRIKEISLKYLWTQVGMAYRTWVDRLDVLWVPAHTLPILRKPGLKTVVTIHGIEYEWLPAYENVLQRWYLPLSTKYAVHSADRIIAVSGFTKRQLVERLGADAGKIDVVYEGVSFKETPFKSGKGVSLRKWGLKPKQYLLFIGTIQPRKNLERLIEAFSKLTPELKLVICGKWGWGYERVRRLISDQRSVIATGYVDDTTRQVLLKNALVYVQPSITEGFGLPVLEAMEAGVPVASSRGGALAEVVGNAGELFDPFDVEDMRVKIKRAMGNRELVRKGRKGVGEFSWEKAASETYNILTNWS